MRSNPDKAFDIKEIVEGTAYSIQVVLEGYGDVPESQFRQTLENLMEEGAVEIGQTKMVTIYITKQLRPSRTSYAKANTI